MDTFDQFKQLEQYDNSLVGKVLVASPHLDDAYFEKSLVYIVSHDETGVVGIIFNHKIGFITASELFRFTHMPATNKLAKNKKFPVLFGGPVNTDNFLALGLNKEQEKFFSAEQRITLFTDAELLVKQLAEGKVDNKLIIAKGIAAWDPEQLEDEIAGNDWIVIQPSIELLFSQRRKNKWDAAIKQLGLRQDSNIVAYSGHA